MLKKDFLLCRTYLWKTLQILIYAFDCLYLTQRLTCFFSTNHLLQLCARFLILFHLPDEVLSINPSANVFVFGDFNVHHKDWLTFSGGTDQPGELCYKLISNDLTQMVNFPTRILDCDSHNLALFDLFLSFDASTMAFLLYNGFPYIGKF